MWGVHPTTTKKNHTLPAKISTFGFLNLPLQIRLAFRYEMLCDKQLNLLFKFMNQDTPTQFAHASI